MNLKRFRSAYLLLSLMTVACSQEVVNESLSEKSESDEEELIVKYNGKTYTTQVVYEGDSVIYLNQEYADIYENEIKTATDLAIYLHKDESGRDIVEYYNSEEDLQESVNISIIENMPVENISTTLTRGSNTLYEIPIDGKILGEALMFDDKGYSDRRVKLKVTEKLYQFIPHLKAFANFNDKTSSIKVYNYMSPNGKYNGDRWQPTGGVPGNDYILGKDLRTCLLGYQNINYKGDVLYCVSNESGDPNPHEDYDLKKIGWNDKISSVEFKIIREDEISEYYPPHD